MAKKSKGPWYLGIDVGGTKIFGRLVSAEGKTDAKEKRKTPRGAKTQQVVDAIVQVVDTLMQVADDDGVAIEAIGVAVPGVTDPHAGRVIFAPNIALQDCDLQGHIRKRVDVPVVLGNDVSLGTLGEKWQGAAKKCDSAVGIFVGTGIGGGIVINNQLVGGARQAAGEIGHILVNRPADGPPQTFEKLASRTAMEDEIRRRVAAGHPTLLTSLLGDDLSLIKSKAFRKALEADDDLVTEVVTHACQWIGMACASVQNLIDPDVIVLGGGVIEACSPHMMPIIEQTAQKHVVPGTKPDCDIKLSKLGDDAVVLGAVAWAKMMLGQPL